ncbi:MAG: VOC family protein [Actinomycetota bacterium]|jgi:lactoylglutathione lyase|nr:VOC family protein [Actinomycetota bacterium]|tara:strand:- start:2878 stop:3270 length:393 start_codon:yes stop_codon:yes gene_type:complete
MTDRLTHIALPCHDLKKTIEWYENFSPLNQIHYRTDSDGSVAWLATEDRSLVIVFISTNDSKEPISTLNQLAHLGISVESCSRVDEIADMGRNAECLAWEPELLPPPVGYICALRDPDGNTVEFSYGQEL